jgi:hypothetical protein
MWLAACGAALLNPFRSIEATSNIAKRKTDLARLNTTPSISLPSPPSTQAGFPFGITTATMWSLGRAVALLSLSSVVLVAYATNTTVKTLLDSFTVPQVFENTNLVRNVNLDRSYPRETANIVIKNIGSKPASEYYYLFPSRLIGHVSGFEAKDRNGAKSRPFRVELAQYASPK